MRYVFFVTGDWNGNASMVRLREFGKHMVARGIDVTYAIDDFEYNRKHLGLDPKANVVFTPRPTKLSATWRRRRAVLRVVASRYLQEQFRTRFGVESVYIPYAAYLPDNPPTTSPFTQPTFVYMGNFMSRYDHDLLFQAAVILKSRGKTPPILFMGQGPDEQKWRDFVRDQDLTNVQVPGFITGEELWRRLRHAHALLFPIRPTISNLARCPSKTFAYAQARRPVITNRVGEVPEVLGDKATYVDTTPESFADAIEQHMTRNLPDVDYGIEQHHWAARTDALISAVEQLGGTGKL